MQLSLEMNFLNRSSESLRENVRDYLTVRIRLHCKWKDAKHPAPEFTSFQNAFKMFVKCSPEFLQECPLQTKAVNGATYGHCEQTQVKFRRSTVQQPVSKKSAEHVVHCKLRTDRFNSKQIFLVYSFFYRDVSFIKFQL